MKLGKAYYQYEKENDGIGSYEYWGQKCIDDQGDYAAGWAALPTEGRSEDELISFLETTHPDFPEYDTMRDYVMERLIECVDLPDTEFEPEIQVEYDKKSGKWVYFVNFQAGLPIPEEPDYEDIEEERELTGWPGDEEVDNV